jgi:hypothetical protein
MRLALVCFWSRWYFWAAVSTTGLCSEARDTWIICCGMSQSRIGIDSMIELRKVIPKREAKQPSRPKIACRPLRMPQGTSHKSEWKVDANEREIALVRQDDGQQQHNARRCQRGMD